MDIDQTISQQEDQNPEIQYQQCPHCGRHFFQGKLQLHLRLCTPQSPMLISPKKTYSPSKHFLSTKQTHCPHCHTKLPAFLFSAHSQKCIDSKQQSRLLEDKQVNQSEPIRKTKQSEPLNLSQKQVTLPLIQKNRQAAEKPKGQQVKEAYRVRIREELRCFKLAQQVQQVECLFCGRMFSKEAALRHVPICEKLRLQEKFVSALRRGKSDRKGDKKASSCLQKSLVAVESQNLSRVSSPKSKMTKKGYPKQKSEALVEKT